MSIEKGLYAAPAGLEAIDAQAEPDIEIEIEDPEAVDIKIGDLEIEMREEEDEFDKNLAEDICQCAINDIGNPVNIIGRCNQSGGEAKRIIQSVERTIGCTDYHALLQAIGYDSLHALFINWLFGLAIGHEFRAEEETQAANVAHDIVLVFERFEIFEATLTHTHSIF